VLLFPRAIGFGRKNRWCKMAETEIKYGECLDTVLADYELS
jgi:hypothetical protein